MHTGLGISTGSPTCVRPPVFGSMRNTTIEFGILVLGQQVLPGGVEGEVPRGLAQRGLMAGGRQLARRRDPR